MVNTNLHQIQHATYDSQNLHILYFPTYNMHPNFEERIYIQERKEKCVYELF